MWDSGLRFIWCVSRFDDRGNRSFASTDGPAEFAGQFVTSLQFVINSSPHSHSHPHSNSLSSSCFALRTPQIEARCCCCCCCTVPARYRSLSLPHCRLTRSRFPADGTFVLALLGHTPRLFGSWHLLLDDPGIFHLHRRITKSSSFSFFKHLPEFLSTIYPIYL